MTVAIPACNEFASDEDVTKSIRGQTYLPRGGRGQTVLGETNLPTTERNRGTELSNARQTIRRMAHRNTIHRNDPIRLSRPS